MKAKKEPDRIGKIAGSGHRTASVIRPLPRLEFVAFDAHSSHNSSMRCAILLVALLASACATTPEPDSAQAATTVVLPSDTTLAEPVTPPAPGAAASQEDGPVIEGYTIAPKLKLKLNEHGYPWLDAAGNKVYEKEEVWALWIKGHRRGYENGETFRHNGKKYQVLNLGPGRKPRVEPVPVLPQVPEEWLDPLPRQPTY